jgi:hypothetical protein
MVSPIGKPLFHLETSADYSTHRLCSDLATIWGSTAYAISSFLQWCKTCDDPDVTEKMVPDLYPDEALNKNPIEELMREPGEMKSSQIHPI